MALIGTMKLIMRADLRTMRLHTCVSTYIYVYVCTYGRTYLHNTTYTEIHTLTHTHIRTYTDMHAHCDAEGAVKLLLTVWWRSLAQVLCMGRRLLSRSGVQGAVQAAV